MMRKLSLMVSLAVLLSLGLAPEIWPQQQFPAAPKAARLYNPQAAEMLNGSIVALNRIPAKRAGRPDRVTMLLQTAQGTVKVLLGPADYVDRQVLKLAPGDTVEVKGMRVARPKINAFIAGEVRNGNQVLKLRDDATGRPLWAPGRKRLLS